MGLETEAGTPGGPPDGGDDTATHKRRGRPPKEKKRTPLNILCVKIGNYASDESVLALQTMVQRHCSLDFDLHCITDRQDELAKFSMFLHRPIEPWKWHGWWQKLQLFNPEAMQSWGIEGRCLYLDLDILVLADLARLLEPIEDDSLWVCPLFYQGAQEDRRCNSSVFSFVPGKDTKLWEMAEAASHNKFIGLPGDQDVITRYLQQGHGHLWEDGTILSFSKDVIQPEEAPGRRAARDPYRPLYSTDDCVIVACHGDNKPWSRKGIMHPLVQDNYPFSRAMTEEKNRLERLQRGVGPMRIHLR